MSRTYGDAFKFERLANVGFYTSNADKLLQARLMFVRRGFDLRHFAASREPYDENYEGDTRSLLRAATHQIENDFGLRSIFFIEDTSLRIDGLSGEQDVPGMAVKEWFRTADLDAISRTLDGLGNRRVCVKSDIALKIPTLSRPIYFHGESWGTLAQSPPTFAPSEQYPWLTPSTFNGWFVPMGSNRRLGEMEFEESEEHDFRAKSLTKLIDYVEELNGIINIRPQHYSIRNLEAERSVQLPFVEADQRIIAVIGNKCSGKTTFADHLAAEGGVAVLEASTILRDLAERAGRKISSSAAALEFLDDFGFDVVGREVASYIPNTGARLVVVSGLRTVEELDVITGEFPHTEVVLIESDPRVRFERHIRRSRDPSVRTYGDFLEMDEEQATFGLIRVASEVASATILNDGSLASYKQKIERALNRPAADKPARVRRHGRRRSELHRSLRALYRIGRAAECLEIANNTKDEGFVRVYNTNRALKSVPEFSRRLDGSGSRLSYELTARGVVLLGVMDRVFDTRPEPPSSF